MIKNRILGSPLRMNLQAFKTTGNMLQSEQLKTGLSKGLIPSKSFKRRGLKSLDLSTHTACLPLLQKIMI